MNSLSVVLAADSATTVEYYGDKGPERRYFKGANKIFQLSEQHPVGLMIYHSASLLGVPWEVTIKEFRKELENKSFNEVVGFSDEFISFIQSNQRFFPDEVRKKSFCQATLSTAVAQALRIGEAKQSEPDPQDILTDFLSGEVALDDVPLDEDEIDDLWQVTKHDVLEANMLLHKYFGEPDEDTMERVARRAFDLHLAGHDTDNGYTGLVFAGFGDHSVFPELVTFGRCKFVGTKFVAGDRKVEKVTHDIPAVMSAFAQTSMTDTFALGLSFDVFAKMQTIFAEELKLIADGIAEANGGVPIEEDILEMVRERLNSSKTKLFRYTESDHSLPLRRVLGVLPVDEMAELAETLINLQSLKEKVTKPSETVGGPVDVAAITRSEGLVWIKRKHYFSSELNSRFFDRRRD
ncbi:hypothetical protein [uncultured Mameliella sp.]|uniref:hypothetical protein n=1 Tax=uncultured Mameliella sp. TaxID=1447087 RepID=UPI0026072667|nr:hypothetical protein [uncultured Mameliella sp.]